MSGPVRVLVAQTYVGVWARLRGVNPRGEPREVVGAVVGGPDVVDTDLPVGRMLAVLLRDYATTGPGHARLLFTDVDAYTELVDDPLDEHGEAALAAHAAAPVLPGMAARVVLRRWMPAKGGWGGGWWKTEVYHDVPTGDLARFESGSTVITSVVWQPCPVPADVLAAAGAVRVASAAALSPYVGLVEAMREQVAR